MKIAVTPHALHLLFCTHTRPDQSQSCGDSSVTQELAEQLKQRFKQEKLPVRVTRTGCLGPCAQGPNAMAYPHGVWFQELKTTDADAVVAEVRRLLGA